MGSSCVGNEAGESQTELRELASIIATGKHICGVATDLSIRCCVQADSWKPAFRGLAFALCCHHVCEWSRYVGKDWLGVHGMDESDFNSMRWFSKLAHSQYKQRRHYGARAQLGFCRGSGLSAYAAAARAELGHLCKRVIDEGRMAFLLAEGWDCRLVRFVDRETSP